MCDYELLFVSDAWVCIDKDYLPVCTNALKNLEFFNTMMIDCSQFDHHQSKPILWKSISEDIPYCTVNTFAYMYANIKFVIIPSLKPKIIPTTDEKIKYLQLLCHLANTTECQEMTKYLCLENNLWLDEVDKFFWMSLAQAANIRSDIFFSVDDRIKIALGLQLDQSETNQKILNFLNIPFGLVADIKNITTQDDKQTIRIYRKATNTLYTIEFSDNNMYYFLVDAIYANFIFKHDDTSFTVHEITNMCNHPMMLKPISNIYKEYCGHIDYITSAIKNSNNTYKQLFDNVSEYVYVLKCFRYIH